MYNNSERSVPPANYTMAISKEAKRSCELLLKYKFRRGVLTGKEMPMATWVMEKSFMETYVKGHSSWSNPYNRVKREWTANRGVQRMSTIA